MRTPASRHPPWVWILLWGVTIAAEVGALMPAFSGRNPPPAWDVAFRLIGGSLAGGGRGAWRGRPRESPRGPVGFAGGGLVAWRRRPANPTGRLMVVTGLSFLAGPLFEQFDAPVMQTLGLLLGDVWIALLVVLLLSFPSGRRMQSATDLALAGAVAFAYLPLGVAWLLFYDQPGNLLAVLPDAGVAHAVDTLQRSLGLCASVATFAVLAQRWRVATPALRRATLPNLAGGVSLLAFAALLASDIVSGTSIHTVLALTWIGGVGLNLAADPVPA